jgi:hypothetical protein
MDMLDLLLEKEKAVEEQMAEAAAKEKTKGESLDLKWLSVDRTKGMMLNYAAKTIKTIETRIQKLPCSKLVWFKGNSLKGHHKWCPGRLANVSEAATSVGLRDSLPLKANQVIVEHFCMPECYFYQFEVVQTDNIRPFDDVYQKKKQKSLAAFMTPKNNSDSQDAAANEPAWDLGYYEQFFEVLKARCNNIGEARVFHQKSKKCADQFLVASLELERERDEAKSLVVDIAIDDADAREETEAARVAARTAEEYERACLAAAKAAASAGPAKTIELRAGDWIRFEHKIFKSARVVRVVSVDPSNKNDPLTLESDDALELYDHITRYHYQVRSSSCNLSWSSF